MLSKKKYLFILVLFFLFSCNKLNEKIKDKQDSFFCNTEEFDEQNQSLFDSKNKNYQFQGINLKTNEDAYSGKFSLKLTNQHKFAFSFHLPVLNPDQHYKVSVRVKGNTEDIKIVAEDSKGYWISSNKVSKKDENDWQLLILDLWVPPYLTSFDKLKAYLWYTGSDTVLADDFKIEYISNKITHIYKEKALRLFVEEHDLEKLKEIRKSAFKNKILETTDDSWVNALILYGDNDYKAKIRFKGDWLDHLKGIKWSFRIKLKKGGAFLGMREFSIQTPSARHYLEEWISHRLFKKEGLLTTRYDFIPVFLNDKNLGLYVYEEHFTKQLIEHNQRREGPIVKFSEDQLWKARVFKEEKNLPNFYASEIIAFKENKTLSDNNLRNQFKNAQNLLYQYKFSSKSASDIFDIEKLAKYFALIDLTKAYHGLIWHNQRFYYNPVLSKLEPIAYDNYSDAGVMQWTERSIYGDIENNQLNKEVNGFNNTLYLFSDTSFTKLYIHYLNKYSEQKYIDGFISDNKNDISHHLKNLAVEFPDYEYDSEFLYTNSKLVQAELKQFINKFNSNKGKLTSDTSFQLSKKYKTDYHKELAPYFVNAYTEGSSIRIINNYPLKIKIQGLSTQKKIITEPFEEEINLNFLSSTEIPKKIEEDLFIFFRIEGQVDILKIPVSKKEYPKNLNTSQHLTKEYDFSLNSSYVINKDKIIFQKGQITISSPIIIPKGFKVIFEAGANIDFINNSLFLSYSPVYFLGNKNETIIIQSSDGTAKGFTVLQAKERSIINHTSFKGLNTLDYNGWTLTGAVNFYESDVRISESSFENNYCEDALNIIRSEFNVENCKFKNIISDAFDSDFCTGTINNCNFINIKNDAIDFSGSEITITNCKIENAGDKGISGGEGSKLTISNTKVNNSKIGFAAKDKSIVSISNCSVTNCRFGLVAFQKKAEYDFAEIIAKNLHTENIINLYLIEEKSKLNLNGKNINGIKKNLAKQLY